MHVALLTPYLTELVGAIQAAGDTWRSYEHMADIEDADFVVSYGYRSIIQSKYIEKYGNRLINLHISYLPWNRGADPNLWSFVDGTPKGVTIHVVDKGLDTGAIVAQREVDLSGTLATSYWQLREAMANLFAETWPLYRNNTLDPKPQCGRGTYHRSLDKLSVMAMLPLKYETKIEDVQMLSCG